MNFVLDIPDRWTESEIILQMGTDLKILGHRVLLD
jgi:hypothetical protein